MGKVADNISMKQNHRKLGRERYEKDWGNYKSDTHKSRKLLKQEISFIMVHGEFTKSDLIIIRDFIKQKGLE